MSWGHDVDGVAVQTQYETVVYGEGPCINVASRDEEEPSQETLDEVLSTIEAMGNEDLVALARNVTRLRVDNGGADWILLRVIRVVSIMLRSRALLECGCGCWVEKS